MTFETIEVVLLLCSMAEPALLHDSDMTWFHSLCLIKANLI